LPSADTLLVFAALSLGLAVTPGRNMLYLVSRALAQGTGAGMVSLAGCQAGSLAIMLCAAAGITAALLAIPHAWDVLQLGGAAYLLWLAWQSVWPGGQPVFAPRAMPREPAARLFSLGFATAALNPKVALFYMAVLPPFITPDQGNAFIQAAVSGWCRC
jgi:threonine/homoserine/homoserine lactone efflux protein